MTLGENSNWRAMTLITTCFDCARADPAMQMSSSSNFNKDACLETRNLIF
jgi:hypothetical protein